MAKRQTDKTDGHYLSGAEVTVDSEINFVTTANPEIDSSTGNCIHKIKTASAAAYALRDDTKGRNIITINTNTDTVTGHSNNYKFIGFNSIFTIQSTNYNAVANDWVDMTTGATNKTVTMPTTPSVNDIVKISKADAGAGDVDVDGNGNNINGSSSDVLASQYLTYLYQYNGTEWRKH